MRGAKPMTHRAVGVKVVAIRPEPGVIETGRGKRCPDSASSARPFEPDIRQPRPIAMTWRPLAPGAPRFMVIPVRAVARSAEIESGPSPLREDGPPRPERG